MKNDSLDKLSAQLNEMGVIRCVLHFKNNDSRKKIYDTEIGQRSIAMFRLAMGQKVENDELVYLFEEQKRETPLYVSAAEPQKEKDILVIKLRDGWYRKWTERNVEFWIEQFEFKNEPCKKWYQFWK